MSVALLLRLLLPAAVLGLLYALMGVYASGQTLLAAMLLAVGALAIWTYSSPRTGALRYLFPGVAAALVFVVFPMLYTFGLGFSNYSARNLLDFERARAYLLEERIREQGSEREFSLHREGDGLRLLLTGAAGELLTPRFRPDAEHPQDLPLVAAGETLAAPLAMAERVALLPALRALRLRDAAGQVYTLSSLRELAQSRPLYVEAADGALTDQLSGTRYQPDAGEGFYTSASGEQLQPGYRVNVGWRHYARVFTEPRFRAPFLSVFVWTAVFAGMTVLLTTALGLLLAVLLNWEDLRYRTTYRTLLFLPYAVPGFISILVFKGLFNQNFGEINAILDALIGVKPAWFADPLLAKIMLLIVNVWLGYPYIMILCTGLLKAIPSDLYEASAIVGAGPLTNFFKITAPLVIKPLAPLLVSAFAFNFNNFVLIALLTDGRPDFLSTKIPAGQTDILVSYTYRIAFKDSGSDFGLAAAISTLIFFLVAAMSLINLRLMRKTQQ